MEKISYTDAIIKYTKPSEWLDYFNLHFGDFWCQLQGVNEKTNDKFFGKWVLFNSKNKEYDFNARQIFPIEIVMDIDCSHKDRAVQTATHLKNKLVRLGFNFSMWETGGKGIHFHLFFPELIEHKVELREYLKREFLKWIEIDAGYVDLTVVYPKRLISLECSKHRKGGYKKLLFNNSNGKKNTLPDIIIERALQEFNKENQMIFVEEIPYTDKSKMKCIKFIESGEVPLKMKDFYRRAAFIYGSLLKGKHKDEYIIKRLMSYLKMNEVAAKDIVRYLNPKRSMTCRGRRNLLRDVKLDNLCLKCIFNKTENEKN